MDSIVTQAKEQWQKEDVDFPAAYKAAQENKNKKRKQKMKTANDGFPAAYPVRQEPKNAAAERADIFEPALKHYARAFRKGEPFFDRAETRLQWYAARLHIMDYLLKIINESPWRDALVLRGSLLLFAYLGDEARRPGDMDFVFSSTAGSQAAASQTTSAARVEQLIQDLLRAVTQNPDTGNARILADRITTDAIWTYERAEGRRIVFPWKAEGLPPGEIQIDLVFDEHLPTPSLQITLPSPFRSGQGRTVWAADKPLSLAWKLLWLSSDRYPQGKDLYDATLLAEQMQTENEILPYGLFCRVLKASPDGDSPPEKFLTPGLPLEWDVDWDNFLVEYPYVTGTAKEWQARLDAALAPTYADASKSKK